jgi:hypothetical protein
VVLICKYEPIRFVYREDQRVFIGKGRLSVAYSEAYKKISFKVNIIRPPSLDFG